MRVVKELKAKTNPVGNSIELSWKNPSETEFPEFAGLKVVRRERTFPADETDGEVYLVDTTKESFTDTGLKGETIYYYTVFTFDNSEPPQHFAPRSSRISAMATSNYGSSKCCYHLLLRRVRALCLSPRVSRKCLVYTRPRYRFAQQKLYLV